MTLFSYKTFRLIYAKRRANRNIVIYNSIYVSRWYQTLFARQKKHAVLASTHSVNREKTGRIVAHMTFPRITAAVFVLLLIGCFALVGIGVVALVGPEMTHSVMTDHNAGTITAIRSDMSFTLKTSDGKQVRFQCTERCKAALSHMVRHKFEKAHTDVYYVEEANNILLALDVD